MASYRIQVKKSAVREIEAIGQRADRRRVVARISSLADDPCPVGSEKLVGGQVEYRVRQGDFRIVYEIHDRRQVVVVVRVRDRKEAYR